MVGRSLPVLLLFSAAIFTDCACVDPSKVVSISCRGDPGVCEEGLRCCPDELCRSDCSMDAGGASGGSAGGATNGGASGGGASAGGAAGGVAACVPGSPCTGNQNPCRFGLTRCEGGLTSCIDGPAATDGIACRNDSLCRRGECVACEADLPCTTNPNPCLEGRTTCGATAGCVDSSTPRPTGAPCGAGRICTAMGSCFECDHGTPCTTNPGGACVTGVVRCTSGSRVCEDSVPIPNGTTCETNKVCIGGTCATCTAGQTCTTNPDPCKFGQTSCGATPACDDAATKPVGSSCGPNRVCDVAGACSACTEGAACTTNPNNTCRTGITRCQSGRPVCLDDAAKAVGTSCGTNMVCTAAGACASCTEGTGCTTNPNAACRTGVTSCSTGASVCVDGPSKPAGTSCGSSQICDANGFCGMCVAGNACTSNPGAPCRAGVTSCVSGSTTCMDAANVANGTSCGVGRVCNAGACTMCVAGGACTTNPNPGCKTGTFSCATGTQVCVDSGNRPAGTTCGTNQVCSVNGNCVNCTANLACATNPGAACRNGVTSCTTGAGVCVDGSNKPAGTTCGSGQVCDSGGNCGACVAGNACNTNSGAPCIAGRTDCSSGTTTCVNGMNAAAGTSCGVGQVCNGGGACIACNAGTSCATNPGACKLGAVACASGAPVCTDGANKPAGTSCGSNLVCSSTGTCGMCTQGASCTTNPNPCFNGTISCGSGVPVCVDGTAKGVGASCGTNLVCTSTNACISCAAGSACTGNPDACRVGTTTCTTGAPMCSDGAPRPNGTACSGGVCNNGSCNACNQGAPCTTNPTAVCRNGTIACGSGAPVCTDGSNKTNGTTCPGGACLNGACNACNAGGACTTNPTSDCKNGVIGCGTGAPVCGDGSNKGNGTACAGGVCNNGFCSACNPGASCTSNPNAACKNGVVDCSTGSAVCVDGSNKMNGTGCPGGVCNSGSCNPCSQGAGCASNPNPDCYNGSISCGSGAPVCTNGSPRPAGTACAGGVCNSGGTCVACVAGSACTPSNVCRTGAVDCSSGGPVCVENGNVMTGTSCPGGVCNTGNCVACAQGATCTTNPSQCRAGVIDCSSGGPVCVDGANKADGTACSGGTYGGTCLTGACCTGCVSAGVCYSGFASATCGIGGDLCFRCPTRTYCDTGSCEPICDPRDC